jgi:hypothetical protein
MFVHLFVSGGVRALRSTLKEYSLDQAVAELSLARDLSFVHRDLPLEFDLHQHAETRS